MSGILRRLAACALGTALAAQPGPLIVQTYLPGGASGRAIELLRAALPDVEIDHRHGEQSELARGGDTRLDVDVLLGVDSLYAVALAQRGRLAPHVRFGTTTLPAEFRDERHRFAVPLLSPMVLVFAKSAWQEVAVPVAFDDLLFDPTTFGKAVLPEPQALPALWVTWTRWNVEREDGSPERALSWLRTLDRNVTGYEARLADVIAALGGTASLSVLPLATVTGLQRLGYRVPIELPVEGHAIAAVAGRDHPAIGDALDYLASTEFAHAMQGSDLLPTPRPDLPRDSLPQHLAMLQQRLAPYDHGKVDLQALFTTWTDSVRGRGAELEWVEFALDLGFTLVFVVFLLFAYRRLKQEPAAGS